MDGKAPSRWKLALLSPWTGLVAAASLGLAAVLGEPWPLYLGAGAGTFWMAFATRPRASRLLFHGKYTKAAEAAKALRRAAAVKQLPEEYADRVTRLAERQKEILRLAGGNANLTMSMIAAEVDKLEEIVESFIELAGSCARWEGHLRSVDYDDLESETRKFETDAERAVDEEQRALARKQLGTLMRRREQLAELKQKVVSGRGQLDLIESSFRLIGNEIMLMRDAKELGGQLDDILVGVGAVREMTAKAQTQGQAQGSG